MIHPFILTSLSLALLLIPACIADTRICATDFDCFDGERCQGGLCVADNDPATDQAEAHDSETSPTDVQNHVGALHGTVLLQDRIDDGDDHSDTSISLDDTAQATVTSIDGSWLIEGVPAGTYAITIGHEGYQNYSLEEQEVTAGENGEVETVVLVPSPGHIRGEVTLEGRSDHSDVDVVATAQWDTQITCSGRTNLTGVYQTSACQPGHYTVEASFSDYVTQTREVDVLSGRVASGVDFTLPRATGDLAGTVLLYDQIGRDSADHRNTAVIVDDTERTTVTDQTGSWSIPGVPVAEYSLTFQHEGYTPSSLEAQGVVAGTTTTVQTVTLFPIPGGIQGRVTLQGAEDHSNVVVTAAAQWDLQVTCEGVTNTEGFYAIADCLPGLYDVAATRLDYQTGTVENVAVESGRNTSGIDFTLVPD